MYNTIIIGSGPSGLMCARFIENSLILEVNEEAAKKLLVTGGGRCNLTNNISDIDFLNELSNKTFLKPAILNFGPKKIMNYFNENGILLKDENGKVYPISNSSKEIVSFLKKDLNIKYGVKITEINKDNYFNIKTNLGEFKSRNLVIATGGRSYSNLGSKGDGYIYAKSFGHKIVPIYPALVPLFTTKLSSLVGLSLDVLLSVPNNHSKGSMIITHKGISGPATFKISEFVNDFVNVNFLPDYSKDEFKKFFISAKQSLEIKTFLRNFFTERLVSFLLLESKVSESIKLASISKKDRDLLNENIFNYKLKIDGKGGIESAIVTGGGVSLSEINPKSMESKIVNNLFFVGEVLDIHGPTGGFNITIALSSGCLAGNFIARNYQI